MRVSDWGLPGKLPRLVFVCAMCVLPIAISTCDAPAQAPADASQSASSQSASSKPAASKSASPKGTEVPAKAADPAAKPVADAPAPGKTVLLWAQGAPKAVGKTPADVPTLTIYLPAHNTTKTGVVIAPGGGYAYLSMRHEGEDIARWLNARGVAAFVLKYRLGPIYHHPVELNDAQRAMRLVRKNAADFGIAPDHIGVWGFSAGGHLAATVATHYDAGNPQSPDAVEKQSCRPDFLILAYPVITLLVPNVHGSSRKFLLGDDAPQALLNNLSDETQVNKDTPPTFLFATTDDGIVPVMNSVAFYTALVKAGVSAEMHLFQHGNHGAGLAEGNPQLSVWPEILIKWMRERGLASANEAPVTPVAVSAPK